MNALDLALMDLKSVDTLLLLDYAAGFERHVMSLPRGRRPLVLTVIHLLRAFASDESTGSQKQAVADLRGFDPSEILSTADAFGRMASEHPEAEPEPLRKTAAVLRALAVEVAEEYDKGKQR